MIQHLLLNHVAQITNEYYWNVSAIDFQYLENELTFIASLIA